jgi:hypothetical protein
VGNGFATMSTNKKYSHTPGTAVPATIVVLLYAAIITRKVILEIGEHAKNVAPKWKPKWLFTTGRTNTILKSRGIRANISPLTAHNAER